MPLNTEHYTYIAGLEDSEDEDFKKNVRPGKHPGTWDSETLCKWQQRRFAAGFMGAQLGANIHGWCVHSDTGLNGWRCLSPNFPTMGEAINWGRTWAKEYPTLRQFYARKDHLAKDLSARSPYQKG